MKRCYTIAFAAAAVAAALVTHQTTASVPGPQPVTARMRVEPKQAVVFRGASLQFEASVLGATAPYAVRWSLVGPGAIDMQGMYSAPPGPAEANVVASAGSGLTDSATVQTVSAPGAAQRLALVSCYDDATIDVRDAATAAPLGSLSVQGRTAGVAVDAGRRRALIASDSQVYALDLRSMHWKASGTFSNARFSEIAMLANGWFVVTDNNAQEGQLGVRAFAINGSGVPVLVASAAAGETPEGIALAGDGRTFYVSNINSNSVMRFTLQRRNRILRTGAVATGDRPFGLAIDPLGKQLFVALNDTATISGARSRPGLERFSLPLMRRVGGVISTGSATSLPLGVAVDAALRRLFVVNEGDGDVVVFDLPSLRRRAALRTGLTPWLPAIDMRNHRLYVPSARSNSISVYDTKELRALRLNLPTCSYPTFIGLERG